MTNEPRLMARPVSRIRCSKTQRIVGYLYEWNNGDQQPAWTGRPMRNVTYDPINPENQPDTTANTFLRSDMKDRPTPATGAVALYRASRR